MKTEIIKILESETTHPQVDVLESGAVHDVIIGTSESDAEANALKTQYGI